jgi:cell division protein FtsB
MASSKSNKLKFYLFAILFIAGLAYLFFNQSGVLKYLKLKSEIKSLNEQISSVQKDNKVLQSEIDSLQNKVPAKIERTAREKYDMIRKGETTIEMKPK